MRTDDELEYRLFPRLIAMAERAWHQAGWEQPFQAGKEYQGGVTHHVDTKALHQDWERFANLLGQRELAKVDKTTLAYRLPVPGAQVAAGVLAANVSLPGLGIEYSVDGGKQWQRYQDNARPQVSGEVMVRTVSPDGKRTSRATTVR
ncbi:Chitobiase precursor [Shimwellia blattae]|nr:Chitobiase precursor [Shimwellia blattae]